MLGAHELLRVVETHPGIDEEGKKIGIDVLLVAQTGHDVQGLGQRFAFFIGPVNRRQRLENVGNRHDPGQHRHVFAA